MKSHETRLSHPLLDPHLDDIKPVVQAGGSDTATLDNVFELLVRGGRDAPMAKAMLIPESLGNNATMPEAHRDLFLYCNAVMEPWDGPAAIAATPLAEYHTASTRGEVLEFSRVRPTLSEIYREVTR